MKPKNNGNCRSRRILSQNQEIIFKKIIEKKILT